MSKIDFVKQSIAPASPGASHIQAFAMTDGGFYFKDETGGSTNALSAPAAIKSIIAGGSTLTTGQIVFANSNGISFGVTNNSVTASMPTVSMYENLLDYPTANAAATNSGAPNVSMQRFSVPFAIQATRLDYLAHVTVAGSTNFSSTMRAMLYTMTGQTANSLASASMTVSASSGGATNNVSGYSGQSGTRWRSMTIGTWNLTPGEYMLGFLNSVSGVAGTTGSMTIYGKSNVPVLLNPGGVAVTQCWDDGIYSAATASLPTAISLNQIDQTNAVARAQPFFRLIGTF